MFNRDLDQYRFRFTKAIIRYVEPPLLSKPFYDATMGPFKRCPYWWLTLFDEDGLYGEAPCSEQMSQIFVPLLLDGSRRTYNEWYYYLYWQIRNRGFRSRAARELAASDLAFHDLMAKEAELPLHRFWGARRDSVEVYGSGGSTSLNENAVAAELSKFVESGYRTVKMKIATSFGTQVDRDVGRVAAARRAIGPKIRLAIDANQCWGVDEALDFANKVAEYDIVWFEEPVHSADLVTMEKLAAKSPIPVAMGESENTYFGFRDMAKIGVKHLQPCVIGPSVLDWMKIRDLATDKGLDFSSGGYSPISAAFIATAPQSALTEYLIPIVKPSFMDTLRKAPVCEHGHFYLPSEPGLPVQPDWERLEVEGQLKKVTYFHARKTKQKVRC